MWVQFLRDYDWAPPEKPKTVVLAFRAASVVFVRYRCAIDAIQAGVAIEAARPAGRGARQW